MQTRQRRSIEQQIENILQNNINNLEDTDTRPNFRQLREELRRLKNIRSRYIEQINIPIVRHKKSGFFELISISNCMCKFMGCEKGELKSRIDVMKFVCKYIKDNDLECPINRRVIIPNYDLKTILFLSEKELPLTYSKIHKILQKHFNGEADKFYSAKTIWTSYRAFKIRRFIKSCALKNKIKNELEMMPKVGIKYFEIKERCNEYLKRE
jgi:chromatin remodeling complex protein RSC6